MEDFDHEHIPLSVMSRHHAVMHAKNPGDFGIDEQEIHINKNGRWKSLLCLHCVFLIKNQELHLKGCK